jgi:hypothetical protein
MNVTEEVKRLSDIIATWITILALSCGGFFTFFQYLDSKEKERIERTMTFHTHFNELVILDSRLKLDENWDSLNRNIIKALTAKNQSQDDISHKYKSIIRNAIHRDIKLRKSIIIVAEFLESVVICVEENLCENSSAKSLFGEYGKSFFRQYYPYICEHGAMCKDDSIYVRIERYFNKNSLGRSCQ